MFFKYTYNIIYVSLVTGVNVHISDLRLPPPFASYSPKVQAGKMIMLASHTSPLHKLHNIPCSKQPASQRFWHFSWKKKVEVGDALRTLIYSESVPPLFLKFIIFIIRYDLNVACRFFLFTKLKCNLRLLYYVMLQYNNDRRASTYSTSNQLSQTSSLKSIRKLCIFILFIK